MPAITGLPLSASRFRLPALKPPVAPSPARPVVAPKPATAVTSGTPTATAPWLKDVWNRWTDWARQQQFSATPAAAATSAAGTINDAYNTAQVNRLVAAQPPRESPDYVRRLRGAYHNMLSQRFGLQRNDPAYKRLYNFYVSNKLYPSGHISPEQHTQLLARLRQDPATLRAIMENDFVLASNLMYGPQKARQLWEQARANVARKLPAPVELRRLYGARHHLTDTNSDQFRKYWQQTVLPMSPAAGKAYTERLRSLGVSPEGIRQTLARRRQQTTNPVQAILQLAERNRGKAFNSEMDAVYGTPDTPFIDRFFDAVAQNPLVGYKVPTGREGVFDNPGAYVDLTSALKHPLRTALAASQSIGAGLSAPVLLPLAYLTERTTGNKGRLEALGNAFQRLGADIVGPLSNAAFGTNMSGAVFGGAGSSSDALGARLLAKANQYSRDFGIPVNDPRNPFTRMLDARQSVSSPTSAEQAAAALRKPLYDKNGNPVSTVGPIERMLRGGTASLVETLPFLVGARGFSRLAGGAATGLSRVAGGASRIAPAASRFAPLLNRIAPVASRTAGGLNWAANAAKMPGLAKFTFGVGATKAGLPEWLRQGMHSTEKSIEEWGMSSVDERNPLAPVWRYLKHPAAVVANTALELGPYGLLSGGVRAAVAKSPLLRTLARRGALAGLRARAASNIAADGLRARAASNIAADGLWSRVAGGTSKLMGSAAKSSLRAPGAALRFIRGNPETLASMQQFGERALAGTKNLVSGAGRKLRNMVRDLQLLRTPARRLQALYDLRGARARLTNALRQKITDPDLLSAAVNRQLKNELTAARESIASQLFRAGVPAEALGDVTAKVERLAGARSRLLQALRNKLPAGADAAAQAARQNQIRKLFNEFRVARHEAQLGLRGLGAEGRMERPLRHMLRRLGAGGPVLDDAAAAAKLTPYQQLRRKLFSPVTRGESAALRRIVPSAGTAGRSFGRGLLLPAELGAYQGVGALTNVLGTGGNPTKDVAGNLIDANGNIIRKADGAVVAENGDLTEAGHAQAQQNLHKQLPEETKERIRQDPGFLDQLTAAYKALPREAQIALAIGVPLALLGLISGVSGKNRWAPLMLLAGLGLGGYGLYKGFGNAYGGKYKELGTVLAYAKAHPGTPLTKRLLIEAWKEYNKTPGTLRTIGRYIPGIGSRLQQFEKLVKERHYDDPSAKVPSYLSILPELRTLYSRPGQNPALLRLLQERIKNKATKGLSNVFGFDAGKAKQKSS